MMTCTMFAVAAIATLASVAPQGRVAAAASSSYGGPVIPILTDERNQDDNGGYTFHYSTGNGIQRQEAGRQSYGQQSEGGWSYISPEGVPVKISFVADQGGYRPVGALLPVAPPLPYARSQRY